ncbi:helix-hairpin-helix domain-containing protein [Rhodococcus sp. NPDC060090]|uniref:helix-hairpin-helix domain-containing protein n=1 Tax=Rhodococcus sp. NPDC060090 TaxID=3347056 RepID=UPI0036659C2D
MATAPPPDSDLPASIGKPATRGLLDAGVVTLDDVAARSKAELAALHGVGPKALRILSDVLAERGQDFAS